jgi:hypothetical protein
MADHYKYNNGTPPVFFAAQPAIDARSSLFVIKKVFVIQ